MLNIWKPGEVEGRGADFPVNTWLRRHTNAHNLTPRFPLPEIHFVSTVLKQILVLGGDNSFHSQPLLFKCWLKPTSTMNHPQKFGFLHPRKLGWKDKSPVSHFYNPFLAAKHLQSQNADRPLSLPHTPH